MRLRDLDAHFVRVRREQVDPTAWIDGVLSPDGVREYLDRVEFPEAHGLWFNCPCQQCKGEGSAVLVGFHGRGAPEDSYSLSCGSNGQPTRWTVSGTGLDDLVLTPSIQTHGRCNWHGFVGSSGVPPGEAA